ncbi:hypothetical protein PoB_005405100 [Plakobranchus ocellatus]|uniref:Uncharacterized protein n=1 Tax=Plakobranchus ocellatus TaxID=259542 RepID=A0AAV4C466_9GAST|nr:hypothetical protein PoB_005405100 [Plakobranchus ocellatus]
MQVVAKAVVGVIVVVLLVLVEMVMMVAVVEMAGMVVLKIVVIFVAGRTGSAVCIRANTIDFAVHPTSLILVANSIAKPLTTVTLPETCMGPSVFWEASAAQAYRRKRIPVCEDSTNLKSSKLPKIYRRWLKEQETRPARNEILHSHMKDAREKREKRLQKRIGWPLKM